MAAFRRQLDLASLFETAQQFWSTVLNLKVCQLKTKKANNKRATEDPNDLEGKKKTKQMTIYGIELNVINYANREQISFKKFQIAEEWPF